MGFKDKAKAAAATGGVLFNVASAPVQNTANMPDKQNEAKAMMRDRANKDAARQRNETRAKGTRAGGNQRGK